jgi:hypothetical protein
MADETPFSPRLVSAIQLLVALDAIDENRGLNLAAISTITKARLILAELLELNADGFAPDRARLEQVIDRLRAKLKSLGQSI